MALKSPVRKAVKQDIHQTIEQVRQLAWAGQHVKAIELASQALSVSKIKIAEQMELLDLRAESYIAQGKLDLAEKDAKAMEKLSKAGKKFAFKAQALDRKAIVQMRTGELKAAVKSAASALHASRSSKFDNGGQN